MPRLSRLLAALAVLASVTVPTTAHAAGGTATVEVRDNSFTPRSMEIRTGDAVRWVALDGGHTVRSDDEVDGVPLFEFPSGSGTLAAGDEHTHVFDRPGAYGYHCEVHPSMTGVVYVDVEPPGPELRSVPSEDHPTITAALEEAPPGTTVEIAPGVYPEAVVITDAQHDVTIRGTGASPADVVLDGGGTRVTGIAAFAPGVRIENLTVRDYTSRGVFLSASDRFRVHRVHGIGNGEHGIRAVRSRAGGITDSEVRGSAVAGISVAECHACGTLIERVVAETNGTGILVTNAGHVLVLGSTASDNGTGIAVRSVPPPATDATRTEAPLRGATVSGNDLEGNGTGIAVAGAWHVEVADNRVVGGLDAIAVSGAPIPVDDVTVAGNTVTGYAGVGLTWDLLGADVCFSANEDPSAAGNAPSTDPPGLQLLFPCAGGV